MSLASASCSGQRQASVSDGCQMTGKTRRDFSSTSWKFSAFSRATSAVAGDGQPSSSNKIFASSCPRLLMASSGLRPFVFSWSQLTRAELERAPPGAAARARHLKSMHYAFPPRESRHRCVSTIKLRSVLKSRVNTCPRLYTSIDPIIGMTSWPNSLPKYCTYTRVTRTPPRAARALAISAFSFFSSERMQHAHY